MGYESSSWEGIDVTISISGQPGILDLESDHSFTCISQPPHGYLHMTSTLRRADAG
jgi:hypothetical protein